MYLLGLVPGSRVPQTLPLWGEGMALQGSTQKHPPAPPPFRYVILDKQLQALVLLSKWETKRIVHV